MGWGWKFVIGLEWHLWTRVTFVNRLGVSFVNGMGWHLWTKVPFIKKGDIYNAYYRPKHTLAQFERHWLVDMGTSTCGYFLSAKLTGWFKFSHLLIQFISSRQSIGKMNCSFLLLFAFSLGIFTNGEILGSSPWSNPYDLAQQQSNLRITKEQLARFDSPERTQLKW